MLRLLSSLEMLVKLMLFELDYFGFLLSVVFLISQLSKASGEQNHLMMSFSYVSSFSMLPFNNSC